jgi:sec-independent protein translocase protein TatA
MFGLGWLEVGVILLVAVLIFGPKKIPDLGSSFAKTLRGFQDGLKDTESDEPPSARDSDGGSDSSKPG